MSKQEYEYDVHTIGSKSLYNHLNRFARNGWRVVSAHRWDEFSTTVVLERKIKK